MKIQRLSLDVWGNIFRNLEEAEEEVEIVWLDSTDEWCLCAGEELFEDAFDTEQEAQERLDYLESIFLRREVCEREIQDGEWVCLNDLTGCLYNDSHNGCSYAGDSCTPLEDE